MTNRGYAAATHKDRENESAPATRAVRPTRNRRGVMKTARDGMDEIVGPIRRTDAHAFRRGEHDEGNSSHPEI